ncbi:MAG: glycosyltransferase family 4 protein [Xenococcaceae cyanobacterium]
MKQSLRVGVDGILIRKQGKGVSRFLVSFLHTFAANPPSDIELTVFITKGVELPPLPSHPKIQYVPIQVFKQITWDLWGFERCLKAIGADLAFTLSDRVRVSRKYLVYFFEIPDYRIADNEAKAGVYQQLSDWMTKNFLASSLQGASHIAASSLFTRNDLITKYQVPEPKVSVIYAAPDPVFVPCSNPEKNQLVREKYQANEGYLLHFSSNNDPRDNTGTLLKAFSLSLKTINHRYKLVIGGVNQLQSFGWDRLLEQLGLQEQVVFAGFVTGNDLVEIFQSADAYVDASLYEGFGFQVAEAITCGIPVICSNVTSLPEVAGDAGILVNPTDEKAIADAIVSVIANPSQRNEMTGKGLQQAKKFSWELTTKELTALMREVAS